MADTNLDTRALQSVFDAAVLRASELAANDALGKRALLAAMVDRVTVYANRVVIMGRLLEDLKPADDNEQPKTSASTMLTIATRIVRTGKRTALAIAPAQVIANQRQDASLIKLIAKAYAARSAVESSISDPKELARDLGHDKDYFARLVRLGYLAPDILIAIIDGRQPVTLTRQRLARVSKLPFDWAEQRQLLGFASA